MYSIMLWWVVTQHQHPGVWGCSIQNWIFIVKVWLKFSTLRRTFFSIKSTDKNDAFSRFFDASTFHWPFFYVSLSYFACVSCDVSMFHFLIAWWREIEVPLCNHAGCIVWIEYADLKLNRHMICCVTRVFFILYTHIFGSRSKSLTTTVTSNKEIEDWAVIFTLKNLFLPHRKTLEK